MTTTAIAMNDSNPQRGPLPNKESVSDLQVQTVLAILEKLTPYIMEPVDDEVVIPGPEADGGVLASAHVTFIGACSVLDGMLAEKNRWSLQEHDELYSEVLQTQRAHQKFLAEQEKTSREIRRPSSRLHPTLASIEGGFIVYYGDLAIENGAIIGRGKTPAAAMLDFDAAFDRPQSDQVKVTPTKSKPKKT